MSFGAVLSFAFGIMGPIALLAACVLEFLARRLRKDPRCDKALLERRQKLADGCLVGAWLLLAAAYLCFQVLAPDAAALASGFEAWMTWMLVALLALDIVYLYLRRDRPRPAGKKKYFWEI